MSHSNYIFIPSGTLASEIANYDKLLVKVSLPLFNVFRYKDTRIDFEDPVMIAVSDTNTYKTGMYLNLILVPVLLHCIHMHVMLVLQYSHVTHAIICFHPVNGNCNCTSIIVSNM